MADNGDEQGLVKPSERSGGNTPDAAELREKGSWAETAVEGLVPTELGGSDAPPELLEEDSELGSDVLGRTTGSDEPTTDQGIDAGGGDEADATTDAGPEPTPGVEPDLKDAAATQLRPDVDSTG